MTDFWADVGLGKGAWQCDDDGGREIPPGADAGVFEETPTRDSPRFAILPDVPTVPPRKDETFLAVFWDGCRYRVEFPDLRRSVGELKRALFRGGLGRGDEMSTGKRREIESVDALALFYACDELSDDSASVESYGVPPGCKILIGLDRALIEAAKRGRIEGDDAYWG